MILKTGQLIYKGNHTNRMEPYALKTLGINDLNDIERLQKKVYNHLDVKEILVMDSLETMEEDLKNGGMVIGAVNGSGQLIAYRFISFPGFGEHNLGRDIGFKQNQLIKSAHLETTVVDPSYRGNGLQGETLKVAIPLIQEQGFDQLLCTVSPKNPYSLYNIMSNGLNIRALKLKYPDEEAPKGKWRFILHRDLASGQNGNILEKYHVEMSNFLKQRHLLDLGFIGNRLVKENEHIQYVKVEAY